jgi:copper chaperone
MKTALKINGMTCEMCVRHVTQALQNVPGVVQADVNLQEGRAVVESDDVAADALVSAVVEEGYEAQVA